MAVESSRFVVGIDLGTTNIAVSYIDTTAEAMDPEILDIPQLVAPGETDKLDLLPAYFFFPDPKTLSENALDLPWHQDPGYAVGVFAKNSGPASAERFVASAKSWLCHAGVDRRAPILPWNSPEELRSFSPIQVTTRYLEHIRHAWDHQFRNHKDENGDACILETQQVVITVPASFDEVARELTLEAAHAAGLTRVTLLEEPLAAFYSWLHWNEDSWKETLNPGERVLVIDVGGGTSDFSFVEADSAWSLNRTVSGEHLLLGGDNIDAALARQCQQEWQRPLTPREWAHLTQQCRNAKEQLLQDDAEAVDVVLLAGGSSVIGGALKTQVTRETLNLLLYQGFFPETASDAQPPARGSGLRTMGLPHVADPALPKHLLEFLRYAARVRREEADGEPLLRPDKVLFNGGTLIPETLRARILDLISAWFDDERPVELSLRDLRLAVAEGAAHFGLSRRGIGVAVKSGTAKSYFVQVDSDHQARFVCVMPRGTDENEEVETPCDFTLRANCKAVFPLYSSATRVTDVAGQVLDTDHELTQLCALTSVLQFGKKGDERELPCRIRSQLTESGVLRLYLESHNTQHVWPLHFDIRQLGDTPAEEAEFLERNAIAIDQARIEQALHALRNAFDNDHEACVKVMKTLERIAELPRDQWPLVFLRAVVDQLFEIGLANITNPSDAARWLNVCGYCLRPGCGDPEDELRLKKVWKFWLQPPVSLSTAELEKEWWIFWRRIAPGLTPGRQENIVATLAKQIFPNGDYKRVAKGNTQVHAERVRCLGAMEYAPVKKKAAWGNSVIAAKGKIQPWETWFLARLGTRRLFRAPLNYVVPPQKVAPWVEYLLKRISSGDQRNRNEIMFAMSRIAAHAKDCTLDLNPDLIQRVADCLQVYQAPANWQLHLVTDSTETRREQAKILGDSLPLGLQLQQM